MYKRSIIAVIVCVFGLMFASCNNKDNTNKQENKQNELVNYNFEECYKSDWQYMQDNYVEKYGKENVLFFFSEAEINQRLCDSIIWDSLRVEKVISLFQVYHNDSSFCVKFSHLYGDSIEIETIPGHWMECLNIDIDSVDIKLMDVLSIVDTMQIDKSMLNNKIVMRCPIFPPFPKHPYWFFGDELNYFVIDSKGNIINK